MLPRITPYQLSQPESRPTCRDIEARLAAMIAARHQRVEQACKSDVRRHITRLFDFFKPHRFANYITPPPQSTCPAFLLYLSY